MTEPRFALRVALLLACAVVCDAASAQATSPSAAASAAEQAQKETDRTMYWIRVLANKPAPVKTSAAAPVAAPAPKPAVAAARPAADAPRKVKVAAAPSATTPDATQASAAVAGAAEPSALSSGQADSLAAAAAIATPPPAPAEEPDPGLVQIKSVRPDFPTFVVSRVHKGNVEVRFEVDPEGTVTDATVVETSNSHLNNAALDAIKQWRFKPTPMAHTALVNLVFDIDAEK